MKGKPVSLPTSRALTIIVILIFASVTWAQGEEGIRSHDAKNHVGELAMVCGVIVGIRYENPASKPDNKGSFTNYLFDVTMDATTLYFDRLPPHHEFMAVIEKVNRREFQHNPESFRDQKVCVYGKVLKYMGKATIALIRPDQIAVTGIEPEGN